MCEAGLENELLGATNLKLGFFLVLRCTDTRRIPEAIGWYRCVMSHVDLTCICAT